MENPQWGYEFDMKEIATGQWQSSYWLINPSGEVTAKTTMPVRTSPDESLDEAQAAGKAEASRKNGQPDEPVNAES